MRADGPEEFLRQKCGELSKWIDVEAVLAVYHVGGSKEKPHCHAVIQLSSEPQKQSFDKRIKGIFGIEKRTQYSTKVWDGNRDVGAASYLFHESDERIIVSKAWSDDEIKAAQAANAAVQKVIALNKERASNKLVDKALEVFVGKSPTKLQILKFMLQACRDGENYYPGSYVLKKYVEEVELKLTTKDDFDAYAEDMCQALFPRRFSEY